MDDSNDRRLNDVRKQIFDMKAVGTEKQKVVDKEKQKDGFLVEKENEKKQKEKRGLVLVRPGICWESSEKPAFIFAHPNPTSEHMLKHGIFEESLIHWCRQFLTPLTDMIDVGAHSGTYSLSLAPFCNRVFAFEAQRMTYFQLCGGIAINQYANVWPHHCALGEKKGFAELNITSEDGGGSTLDKEIPQKQNQTVLRRESCNVLTMDSFHLFPTSHAPKEGHKEVKVGLIKIDVEGHELAVLRGAKETIAKNNHPPIVFEVWTDEWYKPQKQALFEFITKELKYTSIKSTPHANNMFIAQK